MFKGPAWTADPTHNPATVIHSHGRLWRSFLLRRLRRRYRWRNVDIGKVQRSLARERQWDFDDRLLLLLLVGRFELIVLRRHVECNVAAQRIRGFHPADCSQPLRYAVAIGQFLILLAFFVADRQRRDGYL